VQQWLQETLSISDLACNSPRASSARLSSFLSRLRNPLKNRPQGTGLRPQQGKATPLRVALPALKGTYANRGVPTMKADLRAQLVLLNKNVVEMIRLVQRATDAGIWTLHEAARHEARLDLLRAKLNADFKELMALRERANGLQLSAQNAHPLTKKKG
jgi:hypothetical protein